MRTSYCFLVLLYLVFSISAKSQVWQSLGPDDFNEPSVNPASNPSIDFDLAGHPYIAYRDIYSVSGQVKKFNGVTWEQVGNPDIRLNSSASDFFILMDAADVPTIIYQDRLNGYKASVKKFIAGNWVKYGNNDVSLGAAYSMAAAIDASGKLYCAYSDRTQNGELMVTFCADDILWNPIVSLTTGVVSAVSMAIEGYVFTNEGSGYAYVAYADASNSMALSVIRFNSSTSEFVGTPVLSAGNVNYTSIALDPSGTPYVAFTDGANGNKVAVKKFDGANWIDVGTPGFSIGEARNLDLKIDGSGKLYVVYQDWGNPYKTMVKTFDGTNWIDAGSEISAGSNSNQKLALDAGDTPYVIYIHNSFNNKAVVKKLLGSTWATVGTQGVSEGSARSACIVSSSAGIPYIVYMDYDHQMNTIVKKYNGNDWVTLGTSGLSAHGAAFPCIALSSNDIPYVFYVDQTDGATVKKYDGNSWVNVGTPGFFSNGMNNTAIAIDAGGTPYVAYKDLVSTKINVQKFNGTNWEHVGLAGFSIGAIDYISLVLDAGGLPYVTYQDAGNGNMAMVKKFDGANWVDVGTAGISTGAAYRNALAIDGSGTLYASYYDVTEIKVKRFDGSSWVDVGATASGQIYDMSIGVDEDDVPYIAYILSDGSDIKVKKFDGSSWVNVGPSGMIAGKPGIDMSVAFGAGNVPLVSYMNGGAYVKSLGPLSILPLQLTAFNGQMENGNTYLNWKTDDEINTREFIVERSIDGRHYITAGKVPAANASGVHHYTFTDRNVDQSGASVIHYRLKQVDIDGAATYSRVLTLSVERSANRIQCYPNPVIGEANLTITLDKPEQIQARIIDNMGKIVQVQQWFLSAGSTSLSLNMSRLAKGIYYLDIRATSFKKQIGVIKQ